MDTRAKSETPLESEIARAMSALKEHPVSSDEYIRIVDQVTKLHKLKEIEKPSRISKDTLALITANLVGITMILTHEHANVITSKAFSLVMKPR